MRKVKSRCTWTQPFRFTRATSWSSICSAWTSHQQNRGSSELRSWIIAKWNKMSQINMSILMETNNSCCFLSRSSSSSSRRKRNIDECRRSLRSSASIRLSKYSCSIKMLTKLLKVATSPALLEALCRLGSLLHTLEVKANKAARPRTPNRIWQT